MQAPGFDSLKPTNQASGARTLLVSSQRGCLPPSLCPAALPSAEQTATFAEHVIRDHEWDKHLPIYPPGAQFIFYLNPTVAMEWQRDEAGNPAPIERPDTAHYHYRTPPTHLYHARFGYWSYYYDCPNVLEEWKCPHIFDYCGEMLVLPDELIETCGCRLTAFFSRFTPLAWRKCSMNTRALLHLLRQCEMEGAHTEIERFLPLIRAMAERPNGDVMELINFLQTGSVQREICKIEKEQRALEQDLMRSTLQRAHQYFAEQVCRQVA